MNNKAICAIATPPGTSALGIIRVSGNNLQALCSKIFSKQLIDRNAVFLNINNDEEVLDSCVVIYYRAPRSYTGEDVIEIICHGNYIIMNSIIDLLCTLGVRHAEPGEFTKRAFFNNKIDLVQAEAISDLISASDKRAVRAAQNSLSGKFLVEINNIQSAIISTRAEVESIINFPEDEDIPDLSFTKIQNNIRETVALIKQLIKNSKEGLSLNHRRTYAVVGKPNSGKSSIINCLLREDASIVTNKEGTTRDSISYELNINNKIINIIDTAGMRETNDEIEQEGITRSAKSIINADKILYIVDNSKGLTDEDLKIIKKYNIEDYVLIFNKIDITNEAPKKTTKQPKEVYVSALDNNGIELIKDVIEDDFESNDITENLYLSRNRHIYNLEKTNEHLICCDNHISDASLDLLAEELRLSHLALSAILGQNPTEDLLTEIFTSFCIGK